MKILILKTTAISDQIYDKVLVAIKNLSYELQGFIAANDKEAWSAFKNYQIYPAYKIGSLEYDFLLVSDLPDYLNRYLPGLTAAGIPEEKVHSVYWLLQKEIELKYEYCSDPVIQDTLKFLKSSEISCFNQHLAGIPHTANEVYFDPQCQLPFIIFKTIDDKYVKMYYPQNHSFVNVNGKYFVNDVLQEQAETSPHLYTTSDHKVEDGDIIIDAGVCEGNFSLRYITIASKIYLFETDPNWAKPLYYTFKDFQNKVEFFPKFVSNITDDKNIRLDDAVSMACPGGGGE